MESSSIKASLNRRRRSMDRQYSGGRGICKLRAVRCPRSLCKVKVRYRRPEYTIYSTMTKMTTARISCNDDDDDDDDDDGDDDEKGRRRRRQQNKCRLSSLLTLHDLMYLSLTVHSLRGESLPLSLGRSSTVQY
jgi:hypothetical protein